MIRVLVIGSMLLVAQAVPASAETIQLVCQSPEFPPETVTVDLTNKTVKDFGVTMRADITDTMITFRRILADHYEDLRIDRVSGVVTGRSCLNGQCGGWSPVRECHKGKPIF